MSKYEETHNFIYLFSINPFSVKKIEIFIFVRTLTALLHTHVSHIDTLNHVDYELPMNMIIIIIIIVRK